MRLWTRQGHAPRGTLGDDGDDRGGAAADRSAREPPHPPQANQVAVMVLSCMRPVRLCATWSVTSMAPCCRSCAMAVPL
jgi:hypothetical protein